MGARSLFAAADSKQMWLTGVKAQLPLILMEFDTLEWSGDTLRRCAQFTQIIFTLSIVIFLRWSTH